MKKFKLGQVVYTNAVNDLMRRDKSFAVFVYDSFIRYRNCDWGTMVEEDKKLNDAAVENGDMRIFASYTDCTGRKIWIITEWDRSVTTILFPSDY